GCADSGLELPPVTATTRHWYVKPEGNGVVGVNLLVGIFCSRITADCPVVRLFTQISYESAPGTADHENVGVVSGVAIPTGLVRIGTGMVTSSTYWACPRMN